MQSWRRARLAEAPSNWRRIFLPGLLTVLVRALPSSTAAGVRIMDRDSALSVFQNLTGANRTVAEHVLDAHGWDLDSSVNFFLESEGVGFGQGASAVPASPPDYVEEPDDVVVVPPASIPSSRPLPAGARPRSSPIEVR